MYGLSELKKSLLHSGTPQVFPVCVNTRVPFVVRYDDLLMNICASFCEWLMLKSAVQIKLKGYFTKNNWHIDVLIASRRTRRFTVNIFWIQGTVDFAVHQDRCPAERSNDEHVASMSSSWCQDNVLHCRQGVFSEYASFFWTTLNVRSTVVSSLHTTQSPDLSYFCGFECIGCVWVSRILEYGHAALQWLCKLKQLPLILTLQYLIKQVCIVLQQHTV